jgi:hypothetical protein
LEPLAVGKVAVEATGAALAAVVLAVGAQVEIMVAGDKEVVDLDSDPVVGGLEAADLVVAAKRVGSGTGNFLIDTTPGPVFTSKTFQRAQRQK